MSKKTGKNRLQFAKSPYLLQHAENPVDWFSWGTEAFEKARKENKPVFLSIGYATCHWCHVMAHESFEDSEVARLMNGVFVSIKVDREERPDIDGAYMIVCQMMTGSGGWPLSIIMTPDKKPFFSATYIPKSSQYGRIGMLELIPRIKELWEQHKDEVLKTSDEITSALSQTAENSTRAQLPPSVLNRTFTEFAHRFDESHGGFGSAPKFPTPHTLMFLLRYWKRNDEPDALMMVTRTLDAMRKGGVWDHIGFGFHRYATDARWIVPHFEKMLYDQALLAYAYTEAYQATGNLLYQDTAREILTFVMRDMTSPEGGFFAALDADTEGEEGKTYVWTSDEIEAVLGIHAPLFARVFNVTPDGNYADEETGMKTGRNVLYRSSSWQELSQQHQMDEDELRLAIEECRQNLFKARKKRAQPKVDDKVLVDWNGLMIAAFAKAGRVFDERQFTGAALRAADFILRKMGTQEKRLLHRYRDGVAGISGFLDDYSFFIWGLLELYDATFDAQHLRMALLLNRHQIDHFWDKNSGGFFLSADDAEVLIARKKEVYDGATPSGNSVAMLNLSRIAAMTGDTELAQKAESVVNVFSGQVSRSLSAHAFFMMGHDFLVGPSYEVVVAGKRDSEDTKEMLSALAKSFIPHAVLLFRDCGEKMAEITEIAPYCENHICIKGKATAYVCRDQNCKLPTTDVKEMLDILCEK